jgi:acetyl-CoA carboxylase beta subunit
MLDALVDRRELKSEIARLLRHMLGMPLVCEVPLRAAAG